jgi:hypothetical protein
MPQKTNLFVRNEQTLNSMNLINFSVLPSMAETSADIILIVRYLQWATSFGTTIYTLHAYGLRFTSEA